MQAIVVTFDRLATRLVGCYGNEWIETPNLDRLATTSTVFDNHIADSVGPRSGWAWLTGRHAMHPTATVPPKPLGQILRASGVTSQLVTTDGSRSIPWDTAGFDRVRRVDGLNGLDVEPGEVPIAKLVQAGKEILGDGSPTTENRLIWLHAPEPGLPPEGFATLYFEDFEERGFPVAEIPQEDWSRQIAVAAGSMSLVDHWLGDLVAQVAVHGQTAPTLVLIAAARGRSWMEEYLDSTPSIRKDSPVDRLRSHETGSPLLLSVSGDDRYSELVGLRCPRFVQPTDLLPTLLDWFGIPSTPGQYEGRSLLREAVSDQPARSAVVCGDDDRTYGLRTSEWNCLIQLSSADQDVPTQVQMGDADWPPQVQLYSKPEDIWDVTDLATQQPEVCEELVRQMSAFRQG